MTGCSKLAEQAAESKARGGVSVSEPFTQTYSSPNGLITVHYPADFAAKVVGKSSLVLSRNVADGDVELLTFVAVGAPVTNDVNEFSRVINVAEIKELTGYVEKTHENKQCNGAPGVEITSTWQPTADSLDYRRSCAFQRQSHGYSFAYTLPNELLATHRALLEAIIDATTFAP